MITNSMKTLFKIYCFQTLYMQKIDASSRIFTSQILRNELTAVEFKLFILKIDWNHSVHVLQNMDTLCRTDIGRAIVPEYSTEYGSTAVFNVKAAHIWQEGKISLRRVEDTAFYKCLADALLMLC